MGLDIWIFFREKYLTEYSFLQNFYLTGNIKEKKMIRINNIKMPVKHTENDLKKTVYKKG